MKGGIDRRLMLAGAAGLGLAAAPVARADGRVAAMRFAMRGQQPVTTVFVGGKGPFLMLVDTGNSGDCFLRPEIIEKLGLREVGEARIYGATGTDTVRGYMAHDVVIGQIAREPDLAFAATDRVPRGLDGLLPVSLFGNHVTDIDFTTGEIRILVNGSVDRSQFRPIPCERARRSDGRLIANVAIDGVPAKLLVDTGAETTVLLSGPYVAAHGLWNRAKHMDMVMGGMTSQTGAMRMIRAGAVKVGAFKFQDIPISLSDPKRPDAISEIDGLLGIELLKRFTVGLDAGASTLWLKPNAALSDPYVYDHSGLTWEWKGGSAVVRSTAPGSPAETVGLKPGDRILGLATEKEAYAWDRRLSGAPDTAIDVEVMRGSERIPVKIVLKDWL